MKRQGLAVLWCLLLALITGDVRAATLAVLPLEPGASSEEFVGLGKGLAGMLVNDLLEIEGLRLVERERIQALIDEMELSNTNLLDPSTAQKVGKGVGAEFLVLGSYSVVRETFMLDMRVVNVQTGNVVKGEDSQGPIAEFVAVQKEVVEGLLEGLDVELTAGARRKFMGGAATESFGALVSFGEGLELLDNGDVQGAEKAFRKALSDDPEFMVARNSLGSMAEALATAKAQAEQRKEGFASAVHKQIIEGSTDEMTMTGSEVDIAYLVQFAMRMTALFDEGRHCQRAREMRHFGERLKWTFPDFGRHGHHKFKDGVYAARKRIERTNGGLRVKVPVDLFEDMVTFVFHEAYFPHRTDQIGLVGSMAECLDPNAFLAQSDALVASMKGTGMLESPARQASPVTVRDMADLTWAMHHAREIGPGPALTRRVQTMLDRYPTGSDAAEDIVDWVQLVQKSADLHQSARRRRLGKSSEDLERMARGVLGDDSTVFRNEGPFCQYIAVARRASLQSQVVAIDQIRNGGTGNLEIVLELLASDYGVSSDYGCLVGIEGRLDSLHDALAMAQGVTLLPKASATCAQTLSSMTNMQIHPDMADRKSEMYRPEYEGAMGWMVSYFYWELVRSNCIAWE